MAYRSLPCPSISSFLFYFIVIRLDLRSTLLKIFLSVQNIIVDYKYNVVQISRAHSSCLTRSLCLLISNSPFLPPSLQSLATNILLFDSVGLIILDTSYKWNHVVCVFLWLIYFTLHNFLKVYPYCYILQSFVFSRLHSIPLYMHTRFSLLIHLLMDI